MTQFKKKKYSGAFQVQFVLICFADEQKAAKPVLCNGISFVEAGNESFALKTMAGEKCGSHYSLLSYVACLCDEP